MFRIKSLLFRAAILALSFGPAVGLRAQIINPGLGNPSPTQCISGDVAVGIQSNGNANCTPNPAVLGTNVFNVRDYGAVATVRTANDCALAAPPDHTGHHTATITSATMNFTAADNGRTGAIWGYNFSGHSELVGTVVVLNATTINLTGTDDNDWNNFAGKPCEVGVTDDIAFHNAADAAQAANGLVYIPTGTYLLSGPRSATLGAADSAVGTVNLVTGPGTLSGVNSPTIYFLPSVTALGSVLFSQANAQEFINIDGQGIARKTTSAGNNPAISICPASCSYMAIANFQHQVSGGTDSIADFQSSTHHAILDHVSGYVVVFGNAVDSKHGAVRILNNDAVITNSTLGNEGALWLQNASNTTVTNVYIDEGGWGVNNQSTGACLLSGTDGTICDASVLVFSGSKGVVLNSTPLEIGGLTTGEELGGAYTVSVGDASSVTIENSRLPNHANCTALFPYCALRVLSGGSIRLFDIVLNNGTDNLGGGGSFVDLGGNIPNSVALPTVQAGTSVFGDASITGSPLVTGNIVLTSGWDTSTKTGIGGATKAGQFEIDAAGTPGANPVITLTFPAPFWAVPSGGCKMQQIGGTGVLLDVTTGTVTATTAAFTVQGTPVAGLTYIFSYSCSNP